MIDDNAAGGSGDDAGNDIILDTAGNILVAGYSTSASLAADMAVWRFSSDGTLETSFNGTGILHHDVDTVGGLNDWGGAIAFDAAGKILIAGNTQQTIFRDLAVWMIK